MLIFFEGREGETEVKKRREKIIKKQSHVMLEVNREVRFFGLRPTMKITGKEENYSPYCSNGWFRDRSNDLQH